MTGRFFWLGIWGQIGDTQTPKIWVSIYIQSSKGWLTYNDAEYEIMQRLLDNFNILNISLGHTDNVFLISLNIPKPIYRKTSKVKALHAA